MATIQELMALSNGQSFVNQGAASGQQVVVVQNGSNNGSVCLPCEDDVCQVGQSQGVMLDVGKFNHTNSKVELRFDTRPDPTVEQNIVLFTDFNGIEVEYFPRLAALIVPAFGVSEPFVVSYETFVSGGSDQIQPVPGTFYNDSYIGASVTADLPGIYQPGTIITAVAADGLSATINYPVIGGGPTEFTTYVQTNSEPNGNLINEQAGNAVLSEFNDTSLGGGAVLATLGIQYNNVTSPEADNITITAFHLPADLNRSVITTLELTPLCDFCSSNNNGNNVTHQYQVNNGIGKRNGIIITIPPSEAGITGRIQLCFGSLGWDAHTQGTWADQSA